jgi:hypothetical protein
VAQYFTGRRKVGEQFEVKISSHKKLLCTVFKLWEDRPGYECACGQKRKITVEKTWGISKKVSETIESTLESSFGADGVASLKSEIKGTTNHEVEWTYHEMQTEEFECKAPECGCHEVRIAQLVYEYELVCYERGRIFHRDVWDRRWEKTIPELTQSISSWDDTTEYDPRCKDCKSKEVPAFDGRLSIDFGRLCMLPPYEMNPNELKIRVGKVGISYPMVSYHNTARVLEDGGLVMTFPRDFIDPPLLYLSGLEGKEVKGRVRVYSDSGTGPARFDAPIDLEKYTVVRGFGEEEAKSKA